MKIMKPRKKNGQGPAFLNELAEDTRTSFLEKGRFVELQKGCYLAVQGQPLKVMTVIISGDVRLSVNSHGNTVSVASLGDGDVFGEMSVIDPGKASATACVVSSSAVLWNIGYEAFNELIATDTTTGLQVMNALARTLCRKLRHDNEARLRQASEMCAHFLDQDY